MKINYLLVRLLLSASCMMMLQCQLIRAGVQQPMLQIPAIKTPPVIDGKLDDAAWQKSVEISEYIIWTLDTYVKDSLTVWICYDDKNLYVAFRNMDPAASKLQSQEGKNSWDTFLWGRNFNMVQVGYQGMNIQLMADPKGTQTDYRNGDISWNGNWKYAASINQKDWTAEFSIPLSDAALEEATVNKEISLGISRSFPFGESSNWDGKCLLAGPAVATYQYGRWPAPSPGKNFIPFVAHNFSTDKLNVVCELELIPLNDKPEFINQEGQGPSSELQLYVSKEPLRFTYSYSIPAGGTLNEKVQYELPDEGSYYATAAIKSKDGTLIRRNSDFWFTIEPNRKKIKALKMTLGESLATMTRVSNPVADRLRNEAGAVEQDLQKLETFAEIAWKSGQWDELTTRVNEMNGKVFRLLHKAKWTVLHNWQQEDEFAVACTHSIIKLRRDALFPVPISDKIDLSLARNEYESLQLAVLPFGKDLNQLTLEASDLKSNNGSIISKTNIEISLVDYNKIDWQASYVTAYKGWYPDPLIPLKSSVNISGEEVCRPFWITVYAPPGTAAGEYTGTVAVTAAGMKTVKAVVTCRVWDFELPVSGHLKTHTWDDLDNLSGFYNLKEFPFEWYLRFCGLLLKNRLNPGFAGVNYVSQLPDKSGAYDFSKVEKVLSFCIDRGLNRFSIIQMKKGAYTPEEAEIAYKFTAAYARFLRERGWLDKALVELWDEPTDLEWPGIKERAERLKQIDPGLRLQLFAEGGPYNFWDKSTDKFGLNNLVDIWAPLNPVESTETQARGGEIWAYFCTLARESAPNFFIDCPAIYQRSIAWYCWMYGLDGFEHWSTTYFWRNVHAGKTMYQKWPNVPWDSRTYHYFNGEGQLIYPGPDGIPYSSIRLENFREGMEDYEYLYKLKELLSGIDKDTTNPELNAYRQLLNAEDYLLYKYPKNIRATLEHTLRYPDQPELFLESRQKIANAIEALQEYGKK